MPKYIDESGHSYGRLTVIRCAGNQFGMRWVCECVCGRTCVVRGRALRNGTTRSCGCLQRDTTRSLFTIHGDASPSRTSREYRAWASMKNRCLNPKSQGWSIYGGRGITVCGHWHDYPNFLTDMGRCPPGHSLDRVDTDAGYSPDNCRWATLNQQALNKRQSRYWTLDDERISVRGMAEYLAIPTNTLRYWLSVGLEF